MRFSCSIMERAEVVVGISVYPEAMLRGEVPVGVVGDVCELLLELTDVFFVEAQIK